MKKNNFILYRIIILIFIIINIIMLNIVSIQKYYIITILIIFIINNLLKLLLFLFSFVIKINKKFNLMDLNNNNLPIYTILIPLYKEKAVVVKQLLIAINNFDYDLNKLDILLLLEEDDIPTQLEIKTLEKEFKFTTLIVPHSLPKTKPKACNYALKYIKGQYLTIYDVEDIPEPLQLKKAIYEFSQLSEEYICLQARLQFYNKDENLLTNCFAFEYDLYFKYFLQFFSNNFDFFPLSGTSNHFKVDKLLEIGGWDSYNVTEDAELGVRIAFNDYKMKVIDSYTNEEAVANIFDWVKQRNRWMKGYLHTYLTYSIIPIKLYKKLRLKRFLLFQFIFGNANITPLLYIFFFIFYKYHINDQHFIYILNNYNFALYLLINSFIYILFMIKEKHNYSYSKNIILFFCFNLYSFLPFFISFISLNEFLTQPSLWHKTTHKGKKKFSK